LKILEKGMPASEPFKQSITDSMSTFLVVFGVSIRYMKKEGRTRMFLHAFDLAFCESDAALQTEYGTLSSRGGIQSCKTSIHVCRGPSPI
jgi:hypothetical protein